MIRCRTLCCLLFLVLAVGCESPEAVSAPAPGVVRGVVLDPVSESPVAGVTVRAHDMAEARTDSDGRFTLSLPAGQHRLWLTRPGFIDGQLAHVPVRAGETTRVEAHLFFAQAPDEAAVHRYFARSPPSRHELPLDVPGSSVGTGEVSGARATLTEPPVLPAVNRVWRSLRAGALAPSAGRTTAAIQRSRC